MIKTNKAKILVVDDDPVQISVVTQFLSNKNYELFIAKTRNDAFSVLSKQDIDLILLDINLPDGNGIEMCKEIRQQQDYNESLAIIFMTSHHSTETEAEGLSVGANDYIYKPVNELVLNARIDVQLQLLRKTQLLSHFANVDALTELGNRRAFDHQLEVELKRGQREGVPVSLLSLDIDFFKAYNDNYGHPQGDRCLQLVAQCIQAESLRPSDFPFRVGGEEFAVILYNTPSSGAALFAEKIQKRLHQENINHEFSAVTNQVTMSIGISDTLASHYDMLEIMADADAMLYKAKGSGRNKAVTQDWLAAG